MEDLANNEEYDNSEIAENEFDNYLEELKEKLMGNGEDMSSSEDSFKLQNLPKEINFNDEDFSKQWYLINEGQLNIPAFHDLDVKNAWVNGYTGKNVSIVVVDDGLDHRHPDFEGKYV